MKKKRLYLIDGNSYIHRAFHALPILTNSRGKVVNAVYGFTRMLLKLIKNETPDYIAVCFDYPAPTFRHIQYKEYKSTRKETPQDLKSQMPIARQVVDALNIKMFEKQGYEADDLIGTVVHKCINEDIDIVIVTGDKDALQLVSNQVRVLNESKNILFDREKVRETIGISPEEITDYMGLVGDKTDNIPGVRGVGPKTAIELIKKLGSLENVYQNLSQIQDRISEKLISGKEDSFLSRDLAIIKRDAPVDFELDECKLKSVFREKLIELFTDLEFNSLLDQLIEEEDDNSIQYKVLSNERDISRFISKLKGIEYLSIKIEATDTHPMDTEVKGISFGLDVGESYYIPLGDPDFKSKNSLERSTILERLTPFLEDERIKKCGHNIKVIFMILKRFGITLKGIYFDSMIAAYLLNPSKQRYAIEDIALEYLHIKIGSSYSTPKGKSDRSLNQDRDQEKVLSFLCREACVILRLKDVMLHLIEERELGPLYYKVEIPLVEVLAHMEMLGVLVDVKLLERLSVDLGKRLVKLESRIYKESGEKFNINSPKQLSFVLFEKLQLPVIKRIKTGFSTSEEVLLELAKIHPLPAMLMEYRQLQKLKSVYIDALPRLVNPVTGRIHTSFNQTITATGRLSSTDPNLQNIPVKTELGRDVRRAFIPEKGFKFLSADYSQIDLRVLAHISSDKKLKDAFRNDQDVHRITAKEIFGVEERDVDEKMRETAKRVNFGLSYGMTPYGLSKDLGIPQEEAARYIDSYFTKYKGVSAYIDKIIKEAKDAGYVNTLLNRRRYIPELNSNNGNLRSMGERIALNTPIQGSSSDIIKVAMVNLHNRINEKNLRYRLLIQVHDELIFEIPEDKINEARKLIKAEMEKAISLDVPLVASVKTGDNWGDLV